MKSRPIAVELFAGVGGMSLGFFNAGFDVVGAVENDPIHCETYRANHSKTKVMCSDIHYLMGNDIRAASGIGDKPIDLVFGGPPCQGFSMGGKRSLTDPRNRLLFEFMRIVCDLSPRYFVLENVKGLMTKKFQPLLQQLIQGFQYNGYTVQLPLKILNTSNYGVPQNRERVFIMGCKSGESLPNYPQCRNAPPTVWGVLQDLPEVNRHPELFHQDWINHRGRSLTGCQRTVHSPEVINRFAITIPGNIEPVSRFLRLDPNGLSNTLRAGTGQSRGGHTAPRPIHPFTPRCITVREAARLHSYPDSFQFAPTKWYGFRQIGNSVPPLLAQAIAREIIKVC